MLSSFATIFFWMHHHDPDSWSEHGHVTLSVTIETAVHLDINMSMSSNLSRLFLWVSLSLFLSCSLPHLLQEISCQKQRAQLTFDPCMFRLLTESYHRETQSTAERRLVSPLAITAWTTIELGSRKRLLCQKGCDTWMSTNFFKPVSHFFLCLFVCNASRPDSNANTIFAELWRGWSVQGDRGRVSSSTRRGKEQTGTFYTQIQTKVKQHFQSFGYLWLRLT